MSSDFDELRVKVPNVLHVIAENRDGFSACSCGNWNMVIALAELMCNHWTSEPNTTKRQAHIIDSLAAVIKLLEADVRDGKPVFLVNMTNAEQLPPKWDDTEEKMLAICPACFRFLLELKTQLPPEERGVQVTDWAIPTYSTPRRFAIRHIKEVAIEICERIFRSS